MVQQGTRTRAYSSVEECIHGMDEAGVRFSVGPHFAGLFHTNEKTLNRSWEF